MMTAADLAQLIGAVASSLQNRVPVLFLVPAVPLEAGDKLPIVADYDGDGSLTIAIDTSGVFLVASSKTGDA